MSVKVTPKLPTIIREQPEIAAIISKLNTDKSRQPVNPNNINIPSIAISTRDRLTNNENILQLFPDVELCIQILVSSIISPNDMINVSLVYESPDIKLTSDIKSIILDTIKKHITTTYNLENKIFDIIKESLFTKGAYVEAILPEASVDDVINQFDNGQVSIEDMCKTYPSFGFLGKNSDITLSTEDMFNNKLYHSDKKTIKVTQEDLNITITDNYYELISNEVSIRNTDSVVKSKLNTRKLSTENIELDKLFKDNKTFKQKDYVEVSTKSDASRKSLSKPLVFKLPVESVIPVHVMNDPSRHIGYFVLLDENGIPINIETDIKSSDIDINNLYNNTSDNKLNLINKAKSSLIGITKKDAKLDNIEDLYSNILSNMIKSKLKDGVYGNIAEIKDNADVTRVMLIRSLKAQRTRLLFLPAELVSYFAFEHRDNGTGKSLLEKVSLLYSIRAILLFTKLMATMKNSITTTEVSAVLDDDDIDPEKTMERIISETLKTRQTQMPLGFTKVDQLVDWSHKVGFKYNFKHPSLPNIDINVADINSNKIVPDEELDKSIQEFIIMSFGLTPEIVQAGYAADFATTVVAKNLLLAKRVSVLQTKFNGMLTKHIRKLIVNDDTLLDKISNIVKANITDIKKSISVNKDIKLKTDEIATYIISSYCEDINIILPTPELTEAPAMKTAFDTYKTMLEEYLDIVISSEAIPADLAGDISGKMDNIKAIVKTILIKKWMNDNNYLPELAEFVTLNDDGKPVFSILDEYSTYIENITNTVIPFLKSSTKQKTKSDEKIQNIGGDSNMDDNESEDDTSLDDSGGDTADTNTESEDDTSLDDNENDAVVDDIKDNNEVIDVKEDDVDKTEDTPVADVKEK